MKKQVKSMAAAATLAVGLGAGAAQGATIEPIGDDAQPQADKYSPKFYQDFKLAACTSDEHTVEGIVRLYPSITDLQEIQRAGEQVNSNNVVGILNDAWRDTVESFDSVYFTKESTEDQRREVTEVFQQNMDIVAERLEEDEGLSVQAAASMAVPKPGCGR